MALSLENFQSLPLREVQSIHLSVQPSELRLSGSRIDYYEVKLDQCNDDHIRDLGVMVHKIDTVAFESEFGPGTADAPEEIQSILAKEEAVLLLAIDRGDAAKQPGLVGFLCGIPAASYGLEEVHLTQDDGTVMVPPSADAFYLHTIAVLPEDRNRKVGYNLWKLFQKKIFPPYGKWKSLALFAAFRKQDNQAYLLRLLERELQFAQAKEQWRILSKGDIRTYVDEQGTRQNRLIPVCYILLDMRGRHEKDLVVVSSY